jgi:hypothetical protein
MIMLSKRTIVMPTDEEDAASIAALRQIPMRVSWAPKKSGVCALPVTRFRSVSAKVPRPNC